MKKQILFALFLISSISFAQPSSPVLSEPPNLDLVTSGSLTLDWLDVSGVDCYSVQVTTDTTSVGGIINASCVTSQSFYTISVNVLSANTTYWWRVSATNTIGTSPWSNYWSFTTAANAQQELNVLIGDINELVSQGILSFGHGTALNAKISAAESNLAAGNNTAATNELNAFRNQIAAFINSERLPLDVGLMLDGRAVFILSNIGGGNSPVLEGQPLKDYVLFQNYPNPFNPSTIISYSIPVESHVSVKIYDVMGRLAETLVDEIQNSGKYNVTWNANKFSSGIYIYTLKAGNYEESRTMLLSK